MLCVLHRGICSAPVLWGVRLEEKSKMPNSQEKRGNYRKTNGRKREYVINVVYKVGVTKDAPMARCQTRRTPNAA